jgi:hypothetical protein
MRHVAAICLLVAIVPGLAAAQGHRGAPPGRFKQPDQGPGLTAPLPVSPRSFGTWLDDATIVPQRSIWMSTSATVWSTPLADGVDAPAFDIAAGLSPRLQLTVSLPFSRYTVDGESWSGLGNVYGGVKILLARSASGSAGLSATPLLEVQSGDSTSGRRLNAVLPVSFELGGSRGRLYGSTGYFTRGAVFVSGALEMRVSPRAVVTGVLAHTRSTADRESTEVLGLRPDRTDVAGSVAVFLRPNVAAYTSLARTISTMEPDSARFVWSVGVSLGLNAGEQTIPRPPR